MSNLKIPGPARGYTDLLDDAIKKKLQEEETNRASGKGSFHPIRPSSAGKCGRALAYELMEYRGYSYYPKPLKEPNIYRLLELGQSVEYSALRNFKLVTEIQQKYGQQVLTMFKLKRADGSTELVEGSCDRAFITADGKGVVDIKSQKDKFSSYRSSKWDESLSQYGSMDSLIPLSETAFYAPDLDAFIKEVSDDWLADNFYQLNLYVCSEFMQERGIDHGSIYKYNKNDSRHYEIRFAPSPELFEQVRDKFQRVVTAVDAKKPEDVERDKVLGSMVCAFCPFNTQCWGGEDARKAWLTNLPGKKWPEDTHKMGELGVGLEKLFAQYQALLSMDKTREVTEAAILKVLVENKVKKIRLASGEVFEVKYLKSPREHYELRRSKA